MPTPPAIPTMSALSPESATLAIMEATMESAKLMLTPSDKLLTGFLWPTLMPPDTLTTLVLSLESATLVTELESTTGSVRPRRTPSGRWPTVLPGELSLVLTTATDGLLATEPLETVGSATDSTDEINFFQTEI